MDHFCAADLLDGIEPQITVLDVLISERNQEIRVKITVIIIVIISATEAIFACFFSLVSVCFQGYLEVMDDVVKLLEGVDLGSGTNKL